MVTLRRAVLSCLVGAMLPLSRVAAQGAIVTGQVLDQTGQPLSRALVFLDPGRQFSFSDSTGVFRVGPVESGARYTLSYRMTGYEPRSFNVILNAGTRDVGPVALQAGDAPVATLRGAVMDAIVGTPLPNATVEVNGRLIAETDSIGTFTVSSVPIQWGSNELRVSHRSITEAQIVENFWVSNPSETFEFAVVLDVPPVAVPGVTVEASRIPARLQGFYQRMRDVAGTFLTREDIDAREPRRMTDLLAPMRASRRSRAASSFGQAMDSDCRAPLVFIDGQLIGDSNRPIYVDANLQPSINQYVHPDQVEAIELYDAVASVPAVFSLLGSGCGVVAIWTR